MHFLYSQLFNLEWLVNSLPSKRKCKCGLFTFFVVSCWVLERAVVNGGGSGREADALTVTSLDLRLPSVIMSTGLQFLPFPSRVQFGTDQNTHPKPGKELSGSHLSTGHHAAVSRHPQQQQQPRGTKLFHDYWCLVLLLSLHYIHIIGRCIFPPTED